MKRILSLILVLFSITAFSQGVKKQPKPVPAKQQSVQPTADSVAKGIFKSDTVKVIVTLLVEDGSKTWMKGFLVTKYFLPQGFVSPATVQELYDENNKLVAVRPEDIDAIRQADWKSK